VERIVVKRVSADDIGVLVVVAHPGGLAHIDAQVEVLEGLVAELQMT
jgi:hypothetical protein